MNEQSWLHDFPEGNRTYPIKGNEPNDYYKLCPRIRENVLVDINGKCLKTPKFEVCSGCICVGFKDVTEQQIKDVK